MSQIESKKKYLFESMPVKKAILELSVPTIISQLISLIYNVADTYFVGRTGNPYMIAGVSLAFTLFLMSIPFSALFGIGGGSTIARMMGTGELDKAKGVSSYSCWGSVILSAVFSLLVFIFMEPLLNLLGASESTMLYAKQYTTMVVVLGMIPIVLSMVIAHLLRNTGYSSQASIGLSGGGVLNIILDPLFMFVLFPEGSEVLAAASATLLSNVIALIYLIIVFFKVSKSAPVSMKFEDIKGISRQDQKALYSVGIPSALLSGLFDLSTIVINSRMAMHGDLELAALGISMKIERLPNCIGIGISQGMLPLIAYNFSSGNHERMKKIISDARIMGLAMAFICLIMFQFTAPFFVSIFLDSGSNDEAVLATLAFATTFLRIRAFAAPVQFINYHTSYCLQAMGDGKGTMVHAILRILAIYIPLMFILDAIFGVNGLAASLPVGEFLSDILAFYILNRWIKKSGEKI